MSTTDLSTLLDDFAKVLANDPGALDYDSKLYVHNLHGKGAEDVVAVLTRTIQRSEDPGQLYYFSGQRGTGKSTELKRLGSLLNAEPRTRAFVVDALEYLVDTHPLDTIDLLLVIAIAFADRLGQADGLGEAQPTRDGLIARFTSWLQSDVSITGATVGGVKAEFRAQQQSIVARLREFDLSRQERVMADCRKYICEMADAVREKWQCDKVVLMVDSLERLRGIGVQAKEMFDRVVKVFDGDLNQLRIPRLHLILAVPPYLPYLTNVKVLVQLFVLASVRVCEPPAKARRKPREDGVAVMRSVVEKRFPRWREVIEQAALDRLILASGGDVRQLLRRLLLDALDEAYYAQESLPLKADDPIVETILGRHKVELQSLVVREEFPLLKGIAESNALTLERREDLPVAAFFFNVRAVLNYRNGKEWLDLNPLLWDLIETWSSTDQSLSPHASSSGR